MLIDFDTKYRFVKQGEPGYLLLKAGLFRVVSRSDHELLATDLLASWFPAGMPNLLDLADVLERLVISHAYAVAGFLAGYDLRNQARNRLIAMGMSRDGLNRIENLIAETAVTVREELELSKLAIR